MKEAFELIRKKIAEKKEPIRPMVDYVFGSIGMAKAEEKNRLIDEMLSIVSEVEAEYGKKGCALCYLGSPCEYQNEDVRIPDELMGWIPCSERLPEKCGRYLVCNDGVAWIADFFNSTWFGKRCRYSDVIAWMPLPEAYQPTTD